MSFAVAVSGSRKLPQAMTVSAFEVLLWRAGITRLASVTWHHGACPKGVDAHVDGYLRARGVVPVLHPAQWEHGGREAGPRRNAEMIGAVQMLLAIWDGASPGTGGAIKLAAARKMPVLVEIAYT